jgi:predicted component of type VI protein secretion system
VFVSAAEELPFTVGVVADVENGSQVVENPAARNTSGV